MALMIWICGPGLANCLDELKIQRNKQIPFASCDGLATQIKMKQQAQSLVEVSRIDCV